MTQTSKSTRNAKAVQPPQATRQIKAVKAPAAAPQKSATKAAAKRPAKRLAKAEQVVTASTPAPVEPIAPPPEAAKHSSKQGQLIEMLQSSGGATIAQMVAATGWLSHTVRGTISGSLRKRLGLNVVCAAEGDSRVYRIVEAA